MLSMPILPLPLSGPRRLNFTVREITGRTDRRRFVRFAARLYRGDRYWAPGVTSERMRALDRSKNPALAHIRLGLFMAESRTLDEVIGAVAVWADDRAARAASFGMLEVINEEEVAGSLLEAAEAWAQEHVPDARRLRGPMELDPFGSPGLLVDGYNHRPGVLTPYNLPYYPELIERAGYEPVTELLAYRLELSAAHNSSGAEAARLQTEAGIDRANRNPDIHDLQGRPRWEAILPEAEPGPSPATWRIGPESPALTTSELTRHLRGIADRHPSACILAASAGEDGRAVAFGVAAPNIREAALVTIGRRLTGNRSAGLWRAASRSARRAGIRLLPAIVRSDCLGWGLEATLFAELLSRAAQYGYATAEISPVPSGDLGEKARLAALGAIPYNTYAVYEKRL